MATDTLPIIARDIHGGEHEMVVATRVSLVVIEDDAHTRIYAPDAALDLAYRLIELVIHNARQSGAGPFSASF